MLNYGEPTISNVEIKKVISVLKKKFITQGKEVEKFENSLSKKFKSKYCVVVSSGTAALHLAGIALGWKKNDIIVCTPITFVASCNAIIYNEASPFFVDIELENNNLDIDKLENCLKTFSKKNKIKAVVVTDLGGAVVDWEKLYQLKKKFKFQIINDKCHSLGSRYKNNISYSTKYSEVATLSFHAVKHITTGEGGAILTNDKKIYEMCKLLRSHNMIKNKKNYLWKYEINNVGYNYRLTDFQSILGRYQLKNLNFKIKNRIKTAKIYNSEFKKLDYVTLPKIDSFNLNSFHLYILKINFKKYKMTKEYFFKKAFEMGLKLQQHYIPLYKFNYMKKFCINKSLNFPNAETYNQQSISLPIHNNLKKKDIQKVIKIIKKILNK